jgi:hypothetical protein
VEGGPEAAGEPPEEGCASLAVLPVAGHREGVILGFLNRFFWKFNLKEIFYLFFNLIEILFVLHKNLQ